VFHWGVIGLVVFAALPRRRAWLRIFGVQCSLPCDPPAWGSFMQWAMITRFHRAVWDLRPVGKSLGLKSGKAQNEQMFSGLPQSGHPICAQSLHGYSRRQLFANAVIAASRVGS
jgi:hypothetical protein